MNSIMYYKGKVRRCLIILGVIFLLTTSVQASNIDFTQEKSNIVKETDHIRKQFMAIAKNGYFNHLKGVSNQDNINLTKVYLRQIEAMRKKLMSYNEENLNQSSKRDLKTLRGITLYLEDMGQNLIDYLTSTNSEERFDLYNLHLEINNFIANILDKLKEEI